MLQQSTTNSLKVKTAKEAIMKNRMKIIEMKNYYKIKNLDALSGRVETLEDQIGVFGNRSVNLLNLKHGVPGTVGQQQMG